MASKDQGDPFEDEEWLAYADRAIGELLPKIQGSAIGISLVPKGPTDVKFALELGFMVMMDKPIIAVVMPGTKVPAKLVAVADEIVEGDYEDEAFRARLGVAIDRAIKKVRAKDDDSR